MKNLVVTLFWFCIFSATVFAQNYPVGNTTITFADPSRTGGFGTGGGPGRQIETKIYYPATAPGNNTTVATGAFGVVVFGHGFVMGWDSYASIFDSLARAGFVVALPRTEGGILPAHSEFGQDLAYVSEQMVALNTDPASLFYQKLNGNKAIGGHSMGGGSTFLAGQYTTGIDCMVTLAAANTNPSAITAAASVTVPNLVISGGFDCVAPAAQHQTPIYDALAASCKHFVSILEAYHCQFNDYNFNCAFGEGTCAQGGGLDRPDQLTKTRSLMIPYLRYYLYDDCAAWAQFNALVGTSGWLAYQTNCTPTTVNASICSGESYVFNGQSYAAAGTYPAVFTGANGCDSLVNLVLDVDPLPQPNVALNGQVLGTGTYATYQWTLDGTPIIGANGQTYVPVQNGLYAVEVTDGNGCSGLSSPPFSVNFLSTNALEISPIRLFPNPTTGAVQVENLPKGALLHLVDMLGRPLAHYAAHGGSRTSISLSAFPQGVYMLVVETVSTRQVLKLVKE